MRRTNGDLALIALADATAEHADQLAKTAAAKARKDAEERAERERREARERAERERRDIEARLERERRETAQRVEREAAQRRARGVRITTMAAWLALIAVPVWMFSPPGSILWLVVVCCMTVCAVALPYPDRQEVISKPAVIAFALTLFLLIVQAFAGGLPTAALAVPPFAAALIHTVYGLILHARKERMGAR